MRSKKANIPSAWGQMVMPKPRPKAQPRVQKQTHCKLCGLPKKAPHGSASRLSKFIIFRNGEPIENTAANKSDFNFDRSMEYCNPMTCDGPKARPDYAELYKLAEADLGPNYNRARFIKWMQGRPYAAENGPRPE